MGYLKGKNALQMQNTHFIPVDTMEKEKREDTDEYGTFQNL